MFDIVVRQDRESTWAKFLEELRVGKLVMEHLVYIRSRLLCNLSIDDQATFKRDALYLFPTWKEGQAITREYFDTLKNAESVLMDNFNQLQNVLLNVNELVSLVLMVKKITLLTKSSATSLWLLI